MNKKIFGGFICMMLLATAMQAAGTVELDGTLKANMGAEWIGLITPEMNLTDNQSIIIDMGGTNETANETIRINIEKFVDNNRMFAFPRYMVVAAAIMQNKLLPATSIIRGYNFKTVLMNEPLIGGGNESELFLDIPYSHTISGDLPMSENLSLYIYAAGILPGGTIGDEQYLPLVKQIINLEITYT